MPCNLFNTLLLQNQNKFQEGSLCIEFIQYRDWMCLLDKLWVIPSADLDSNFQEDNPCNRHFILHLSKCLAYIFLGKHYQFLQQSILERLGSLRTYLVDNSSLQGIFLYLQVNHFQPHRKFQQCIVKQIEDCWYLQKVLTYQLNSMYLHSKCLVSYYHELLNLSDSSLCLSDKNYQLDKVSLGIDFPQVSKWSQAYIL